MVSRSTQSALADASAGVLGSLVAMLAFYPVDVIKTNLQISNSVNNKKEENSSFIFLSSKENLTIQHLLSHYFRGVHFKISHTVSSSFAYFFLYSWIQSTHRQISRGIEMVHPSKPYNYRPRTSTRLLLAAVAAMMNTCLTLPLDVLSARSQSENVDSTKKAESTDLKRPSNSNKNWKHLWRGLWPSLLLCSNPSIHFTVFDLIKARVLDQKREKKSTPTLTWVEAFLFGMIAKFAATILTYPLIRAKVRLMVNKANEPDTDIEMHHSEVDQKETFANENKDLTMTRILISTYQNEGIVGLYKGCNLQLIHTLLKSALLMMVRERITTTSRRIIVGDNIDDGTHN